MRQFEIASWRNFVVIAGFSSRTCWRARCVVMPVRNCIATAQDVSDERIARERPHAELHHTMHYC
jgi:hypothetical protein